MPSFGYWIPLGSKWRSQTSDSQQAQIPTALVLDFKGLQPFNDYTVLVKSLEHLNQFFCSPPGGGWLTLQRLVTAYIRVLLRCCLCVCNQWAYADNCADAVNWLLIFHALLYHTPLIQQNQPIEPVEVETSFYLVFVGSQPLKNFKSY